MREGFRKWVKGGLTGDDVAVLLGHVEDRSPLDIYKEKLSIFDNEKESYFESVANKAEPRVLSLVMAQLGKDFYPTPENLAKYPFVRSYVAGRNESEIVVIKFISRANFDHYKNGGALLDKHFAIVQHDIMVHQAQTCHFVGYVFDKATKAIDTKYMIMIDAEKDIPHLTDTWGIYLKFWGDVKAKRAPLPIGVDRVELADILRDIVMTDPVDPEDRETLTERIRNATFSFLGGGL